MSDGEYDKRSADRRRQVQRFSTAFFLMCIDSLLAATRRDLLGAVIVVAIIDANSRDLDAQGGAGGLYASMDSPPPDSVRKPVSAYAIAKRLALPYETVRRHVKALTDEGVCRRVGEEGVIVPTAYMSASPMMRAVEAIGRHTRDFLVALHRTGLLAELGGPAEGFSPRPEQARRMQRLTNAFFLECVDALLVTPRDLLTGVIVIALIDANIRGIDGPGGDGDRFAALQDVVPDDQRRPVSAYAVSKRLGLPYETVRRHVKTLVDAGVCRRVGENGVIIPADFLMSPRAMRVGQACEVAVTHYVAAIRNAGAA